jgi:hypothetical protein
MSRPTIVTGALALAWLLFRSGAKPSRMVYPCQQAAIGTASLVFGAPLVAALLFTRRRAHRWLRSPLALSALAESGSAAMAKSPASFPPLGRLDADPREP